MRIGLYFGSFNPIHHGHLIIAQFVLNQSDLDEIWFIVSPQNPLKQVRDLFDEKDRLAMVNMAIENQPRFKGSDIEFDMPRPSYTYNTLQKLKKEQPDNEYVILMGSDNLVHFDKWKEHEQILLEHEMIVYNRDTQISGDFAKNQKVRIIKGPILNISAQQIRGYMRMGKSVKYFVPQKVEEYLEKMG